MEIIELLYIVNKVCAVDFFCVILKFSSAWHYSSKFNCNLFAFRAGTALNSMEVVMTAPCEEFPSLDMNEMCKA